MMYVSVLLSAKVIFVDLTDCPAVVATVVTKHLPQYLDNVASR